MKLFAIGALCRAGCVLLRQEECIHAEFSVARSSATIVIIIVLPRLFDIEFTPLVKHDIANWPMKLVMEWWIVCA